MYSQIIQVVRTKQEASVILEELADLSDSLYESGNKGYDSTLRNKVRGWVAEIINSETKEGTDKNEYLSNLKNEIEKLPVIGMTLAFEPTSQFLEVISTFIRGSTNSSALIDIEVGPSIMGGLIISHKGIYKDYSLLKVVDSSDAEIEEIVRERLNYSTN